MKSTTPRICPNCGATNTGRSLFCAECGADLNQPPDPTMTRALGPAPDSTATTGSDQRTEAYAPAWGQSWSGNDHDAGGNQTGNAPAAPAAPAVRTPVTPVTPTGSTTISPVLTPSDPESSSRGFYLGLIAILIIIAIALALGWLAWIQPNL